MKTAQEIMPEFVQRNTRSLRERQAAILETLDAFMEQDETEHRETLKVLRTALNEDRPYQRSVFNKTLETQ